MEQETKKMGSAIDSINLSQEDVLLRATKTDDELRELGWKQCTGCKEMRPPKLYYKSSRRNNLSYSCKYCHRKKIRAYRNVPDSYNFFYRRLEKMRTKARKRGLEFTLTVEDYKHLKDAEFCWYCKDPMEIVSIERVDNDRGYVIDNVQAVCMMCNKLKSNIKFNEREMKIIGTAIKMFNARMRKLASEEIIESPVI